MNWKNKEHWLSFSCFWNKPLLTAGAVLLLLCFLPFRITSNRLFWNAVFDAGHFAMFFLFTVVAYLSLEKHHRKMSSLLMLTTMSCVAAGAIELIQPFFGRNASLRDLINGVLGALAACGLLYAKEFSDRTKLFCLALAASGSLQLVLLLPAWHAWQSIAWQKEKFPLLADFEEPQENILWQATLGADISISDKYPATGDKCLKVDIDKHGWGTTIFSPPSLSWEGYRTLVFEVFNTSEQPFTLTIRIDDYNDCTAYEDRFNYSTKIMPGPNSVEIDITEIAAGPKNRALEIAKIKRVLFFTKPESGPLSFFIDHLRLQ